MEVTTTAVRKEDELVAIQGIARDITQRKAAEKALREARGKLVRAREDERRRLAGELHDSVGQSLIALQLSIQNILAEERRSRGRSASEACAAVAQRCGEIVAEVRHICHGLYPPTLESLGLAAALRQLASGSEHPQVNVAVDVCPELSEDRLEPDVQIALFRIAQEAVSNAFRHADAARIRVEVRYAEGKVRLAVSDDGKGFDADSARAMGLGLNSMGERAQAIGGRIRIDSSDEGTTVRVEAPARLVGKEA